jgi:hypothetical protein
MDKTRGELPHASFDWAILVIGPTVTIILATTGAIGGGFNNVPWKSINNYAPSSVSFLFKLVFLECIRVFT